MVKHIVMWKVQDHAVHGTKQEILAQMKERLEALKGQVKGLIDIEVGINFNEAPAAFDVALYSLFESKEALLFYQGHPKHLEVANGLVRQVAVERAVVDFEC